LEEGRVGQMTVKVTEKDIQAGVRSQTQLCPIALAIRRDLSCDVGVGTYTVSLAMSPYQYLLPPKARAFIQRFDAGMSVEPFTFELRELRENPHLR
jgi:hypothetical protein